MHSLCKFARFSFPLIGPVDRDTHAVEHIVFRPVARIQSVQTTDSRFEQGFRFDIGSVLDSKAVHIFDYAVAVKR